MRCSPNKMANIDLAARGNVNSEERRPVVTIFKRLSWLWWWQGQRWRWCWIENWNDNLWWEVEAAFSSESWQKHKDLKRPISRKGSLIKDSEKFYVMLSAQVAILNQTWPPKKYPFQNQSSPLQTRIGQRIGHRITVNWVFSKSDEAARTGGWALITTKGNEFAQATGFKTVSTARITCLVLTFYFTLFQILLGSLLRRINAKFLFF